MIINFHPNDMQYFDEEHLFESEIRHNFLFISNRKYGNQSIKAKSRSFTILFSLFYKNIDFLMDLKG